MLQAVRRARLPQHPTQPFHLPFAIMSSSTPTRTRHAFAPLGQPPRSADEMELQGIVFDMDGTLCKPPLPFPSSPPPHHPQPPSDCRSTGLPQNHMFAAMRAACAIPAADDILDYIHALPDDDQRAAFAKIQAIERAAMAEQVPQEGLVALMEWLDRQGVRRAICTRNFECVVPLSFPKHGT